jgi:hypothetical protein
MFFFFLISQKSILKKAQRGATLSTQGVYKGARGRKRREREIRKTNHPRGQPARCLGEKGKKKKVEKFLKRCLKESRFLLLLSNSHPEEYLLI